VTGKNRLTSTGSRPLRSKLTLGKNRKNKNENLKQHPVRD